MSRKMRRATIFYILSLAAVIVGITAVVHVGDTFSAPHDLAGIWQLEPTTPTLGSMLRVRQSGKFLQLLFDGGPKLDLILQEQSPTPGGGMVMRLADQTSTLALQLDPNGKAFTATLAGPSEAAFAGQWVGKETAVAPGPKELAAAQRSPLHRFLDNPSALLIAQVLVVLALSRLMGTLFAKLHQPLVVGEMIAGIMLGPSLFGLLFPTASAALFPQGGLANLNTLSQIGVMFFLFLIGLELDPQLLRNRGHAAVVISHISIVAPFLLGAVLTLHLYTHVFNHDMRFLSVALFMGAAMSITAFPVLARILTERNLHKTPVGAVTITCAAVDDVTAWCVLAFVVAIARATGVRPALLTAAEAAVYVMLMFLVIRPFLRRLQVVHERQGRLSQGVIAIIFLLVLLSAYTTESIGIHALFGAFLMGAIMPKGTQFVRTISEKLEDFTVVFLLPLFFAFTGLKTQIGLLNTPALWVDTGLVIAAACLGKFGGSTLAARACGMGWRESSIIGILMNTRGLMELVILNIGQDLGVITPAVFAMMVLMALATTGITTPILQLIGSKRWFGQPAGAAGATPRRPGIFGVLIPVADPRSGGPLLRVAQNLAGLAAAGGRIIALHLTRPVDRDAYRSGLDEPRRGALPDPLRPLLDNAAAANIAVEPLAFTSRDVPTDIARVARDEQADLVLMGFHRSVVGRTFLGGVVHRVLTGVATDVAVFVDHGFVAARQVLVPYLGGKHDALALDLAGRIARNANAQLTVLHVVDPVRGDDRKLNVQQAIDRIYHDPAQPSQVRLRVVEDVSPVDAVLQIAGEFDLVVIGIAEQWGLSSQLFGWRPERIAAGSPVSLLIVRKYLQTAEE